MARDDRLKKVQGVGADFLETARARAEEFLRELSRAGGDTQERAQGALDDLMEGGRKGTEQLVTLIRREITTQLSSLGLATKDDLAALERKLSAGRASSATAKTAAPRSSTTARKTAARKTAEATGSGAAKATAAKATSAKSAARKSTAAKKAAE